MDYKQKYQKYKQKYLNLLKSQKGGKPFLMDILPGPVFSYLFERNQRLLQLIYTNRQPVMMQPLGNFTLNHRYRLNLLSRSSISVILATRLVQCEIKNRLELQLANRIISRTHKLPEISPPTLAKTLKISNVIHSVAFHPTLPLLATGSRDNIQLWHLDNPNGSAATCVATLNSTNGGHSNWILSVAFHPTLPLLATGSEDNTVKLWRLDKSNGLAAKCVATLDISKGGYTNNVYSVAFHPTFPFLATGSQDSTAKLWRLDNLDGSAATCVATLDNREDISWMDNNYVNSVAFHPTAPLLATGSDDKTTKLYRFSPDGLVVTFVAILVGHIKRVISVAFHPTLPILATGSGDETVKLWRFSPNGSLEKNMNAKCVVTLDRNKGGHTDSVYSVAFHKTLPLLATGSSDNTTKLWHLVHTPDGSISGATCVATLDSSNNDSDSYIFSVAFHSTLPLLATGSFNKNANLWNLLNL